MKTWFFFDIWYNSDGHFHPVYYAVLEQGGYVTDGSTLSQAIYMAHDLIACLRCPPSFSKEPHISSVGEAAKIIEVPRENCIGCMDIDVELLPDKFWIRRGDLAPAKKQPSRIRMQERAFCLSYKEVVLDASTLEEQETKASS